LAGNASTPDNVPTALPLAANASIGGNLTAAQPLPAAVNATTALSPATEEPQNATASLLPGKARASCRRQLSCHPPALPPARLDATHMHTRTSSAAPARSPQPSLRVAQPTHAARPPMPSCPHSSPLVHAATDAVAAEPMAGPAIDVELTAPAPVSATPVESGAQAGGAASAGVVTLAVVAAAIWLL
jgi:hypothetical protein